MESTVTDTQPETEQSPELQQFRLREQLHEELRAASLDLIADRCATRMNVIVSYLLPDDYDPEDGSYAHCTPVYESHRWRPILGSSHFGVTDDARLTIFDKVVKRPAVVLIRTFQVSNEQLEGLIANLRKTPDLP